MLGFVNITFFLLLNSEGTSFISSVNYPKAITMASILLRAQSG